MKQESGKKEKKSRSPFNISCAIHSLSDTHFYGEEKKTRPLKCSLNCSLNNELKRVLSLHDNETKEGKGCQIRGLSRWMIDKGWEFSPLHYPVIEGFPGEITGKAGINCCWCAAWQNDTNFPGTSLDTGGWAHFFRIDPFSISLESDR